MIRKSTSPDFDNQLTDFATPQPFKHDSAQKSTFESKTQVPNFTPKRVMGNGAFGKLDSH
jgi:hypothetical protein